MAREHKKKRKDTELELALTIDPSDLEHDLVESLRWYGYYGGMAAKAWATARKARVKRENLAGQFYLVSKDDLLDNGRPPSDKFIEMELTQDKDWAAAQAEYSEAKADAEVLQVAVKGLEMKLEAIRTLLANERSDKQLHLRDK